MTTATALLTAEQFAELPDDGRRLELVNGVVTEMSRPRPGHGIVCARISRFLDTFAEQHDLGYVMSNDAGVVTTRGPDSVRGPDVCYFTYGRLPKGTVSYTAYAGAAPEIVFEVRSPNDRWRDLTAKAFEYIDAGVLAVCLVDPSVGSVAVHRGDEFPQTLSNSDELRLPELHPDFAVKVNRFFP